MILTDDKQVEALEEARRLALEPVTEENLRDPPPTYSPVQDLPPHTHPYPHSHPPPPPHPAHHDHLAHQHYLNHLNHLNYANSPIHPFYTHPHHAHPHSHHRPPPHHTLPPLIPNPSSYAPSESDDLSSDAGYAELDSSVDGASTVVSSNPASPTLTASTRTLIGAGGHHQRIHDARWNNNGHRHGGYGGRGRRGGHHGHGHGHGHLHGHGRLALGGIGIGIDYNLNSPTGFIPSSAISESDSTPTATSPTAAAAIAGPTTSSSSLVDKTKPTNHVHLTHLHTSIHQTIVLDPTLFVPIYLRPKLAKGDTEETRANLRLESVHGNVNVDVSVVDWVKDQEGGGGRGGGLGGGKARALIRLKSTHGSIHAKIHGTPNRHPFILNASASNGDIRLYIPRSFHGPIIIKHKHGSVRFSETVGEKLMTFGDIDGTKRCFLGDFGKWGNGTTTSASVGNGRTAEGRRRGSTFSGGGSRGGTANDDEYEDDDDSLDTSTVVATNDDTHQPFSFASLSSTSPSARLTNNIRNNIRNHPRISNNNNNNNNSGGHGVNGRSRNATVNLGSGIGQTWGGDEIVVDVKHGNVKIGYDDDGVNGAGGGGAKGKPSFLNRIFGF